MSTASLSERRICASCNQPRSADDFDGRMGETTTCTICRGYSRPRLKQSAPRVERPREILAAVERERVHLAVVPDVTRPTTRAECADVPRPCPFITCKFSLYLDITRVGSIHFNFPDLEPGELPADLSCALDVADYGGISLDEVGVAINVTRERIRQIEARALKRARKPLHEYADDGLDRIDPRRRELPQGAIPVAAPVEASEEVDVVDASEPKAIDDRVVGADRLWDLYAGGDVARGYVEARRAVRAEQEEP